MTLRLSFVGGWICLGMNQEAQLGRVGLRCDIAAGTHTHTHLHTQSKDTRRDWCVLLLLVYDLGGCRVRDIFVWGGW